MSLFFFRKRSKYRNSQFHGLFGSSLGKLESIWQANGLQEQRGIFYLFCFYQSPSRPEHQNGLGYRWEMAQRVKLGPPEKPANFSSVPGTHRVAGEDGLLRVVLWPRQTHMEHEHARPPPPPATTILSKWKTLYWWASLIYMLLCKSPFTDFWGKKIWKAKMKLV